jgi:Holliday junction DNA helicase RuvA
MIASLHGRVIDKDEAGVVVELGGLGLHAAVPNRLRDETRVGENLHLHTYLVVRETELTLYGFETKEEREFFELLLGVNGVGPRLALSAISTMNPTAIRRAVFNEQAEVFNLIPGVGKKTAQKILIHLQDKITAVDSLEPVSAMDEADTEVLAALTAMGFSIVEAQSALQAIPRDAPDGVEERLRIALGYFQKP